MELSDRNSSTATFVERINRFEDEALQKRLEFLEWRKTNLLTKYSIRGNDIKKTIRGFKISSGHSSFGVKCNDLPKDYPTLTLGSTDNLRQMNVRYKTPKIRREPGRLSWDIHGERKGSNDDVDPSDGSLFSLANMMRWRSSNDFLRQEKYIQLPGLDAIPKQLRKNVRQSQFLSMKARGTSGRLHDYQPKYKVKKFSSTSALANDLEVIKGNSASLPEESDESEHA